MSEAGGESGSGSSQRVLRPAGRGERITHKVKVTVGPGAEVSAIAVPSSGRPKDGQEIQI